MTENKTPDEFFTRDEPGAEPPPRAAARPAPDHPGPHHTNAPGRPATGIQLATPADHGEEEQPKPKRAYKKREAKTVQAPTPPTAVEPAPTPAATPTARSAPRKVKPVKRHKPAKKAHRKVSKPVRKPAPKKTRKTPAKRRKAMPEGILARLIRRFDAVIFPEPKVKAKRKIKRARK